MRARSKSHSEARERVELPNRSPVTTFNGDTNYWPTIHVLNGSGGAYMLPNKGRGMLIVDGDPHRDIRLLQDASRRTAVLKGGQFMSGSLLSLAEAHRRRTIAVTA